MQVSRTLRFLSLPAALGLGAALAVACSDGAPTAPDQSPSFGKKKHQPSAIDATSTTDCAFFGAYTLTTVNPGSGADDNGDGYICKKTTLKK